LPFWPGGLLAMVQEAFHVLVVALSFLALPFGPRRCRLAREQTARAVRQG
jgi:hypothetical protein